MSRRKRLHPFRGTHATHARDARKYAKDARRFLSWARDDVRKGKCQGALANLLGAARAEGRLSESRAGAGRRVTGTPAIRKAEARFFKACLVGRRK